MWTGRIRCGKRSLTCLICCLRFFSWSLPRDQRSRSIAKQTGSQPLSHSASMPRQACSTQPPRVTDSPPPSVVFRGEDDLFRLPPPSQPLLLRGVQRLNFLRIRMQFPGFLSIACRWLYVIIYIYTYKRRFVLSVLCCNVTFKSRSSEIARDEML